MRSTTARIDVHLEPHELGRSLREDARRGLSSRPKELPPKWFYDERGSRLFDEITRLDEYYPTRREREILRSRATEIARVSRAQTLVELGSGTSEKTRLLLDALQNEGALQRFIPFDVSEAVLREAAHAVNDEYPSIEVHAVVGDFERHMYAIPDSDRRLIAFLGGTIGNFPPELRAGFLETLAGVMHSGDSVLIGFDLVKDVKRLEAAYNDARGVTADFNRNILRVLNRELRGDFDVHRFEHVAFWDRSREWIEMRLRSESHQTITLDEIGLEIDFEPGEEMRTETSAKFRPEGVKNELLAAGLSLERWWTDAAGDFGLALAVLA